MKDYSKNGFVLCNFDDFTEDGKLLPGSPDANRRWIKRDMIPSPKPIGVR